jgi:hypothetical protein
VWFSLKRIRKRLDKRCHHSRTKRSISGNVQKGKPTDTICCYHLSISLDRKTTIRENLNVVIEKENKKEDDNTLDGSCRTFVGEMFDGSRLTSYFPIYRIQHVCVLLFVRKL